jgi:hypothetical protein
MDEVCLRFVSDDLEATPFLELGEGVFTDAWYARLVIEEHGFRGVDFGRDFRRRVDLRDNLERGKRKSSRERRMRQSGACGLQMMWDQDTPDK